MRERESSSLFNSPCLLNQIGTIFEKQQILNHWFINVDCFTCLQSHTFCKFYKLSCGCLKVKNPAFQ